MEEESREKYGVLNMEQLKKMCKLKSLKVGGRKPELVDRLIVCKQT